MNRLHLLFAALLVSAATANAQTILKGDMDNNNRITFTDVWMLAQTVVGKLPMERVDITLFAERVNNTQIIGTWQTQSGTSITFNADGTTDYPNGPTYECYPLKDRILIFGQSGAAIKTFNLLKVTDAYFVTIDFATNEITYYYKQTNP